MERIRDILAAINERIGRIFAWTTVLLVIVISIDVILRYLFNFSFIWITEVEIYLFALSFLFGSGYAFKHDKHVRVDLFYENWSEKRKAWVNLIGGLLFLTPWCIVAIISCYKYASFSYGFRESSSQAGGLPALYILKFCLMMGFVFLLIQGISSMIDAVITIRDGGKVKEEDR